MAQNVAQSTACFAENAYYKNAEAKASNICADKTEVKAPEASDMPTYKALKDVAPNDGSAAPESAENNSARIEELLSAAFEFEFVLSARAFEHNNSVVVALIVSPFVLKSERDAALRGVKETLEKMTSNTDVVVTFDTTVFRRITDNMSDEYKSELLNLAKQRS